MVILGWVLAIAVAVVVIAIAVMFLNRFYRKSTRDIALVRTGFGGQRILISGGCLALPFLHKVEEINMRTLRIEVRRAGDKSVITEDRMRVDVELEFYVRVIPTPDGIATAAQVDAVQAVAARHTMDSLHEGRAEFVANVSELLRENLRQNGILLDSVSLTRFRCARPSSKPPNSGSSSRSRKSRRRSISTWKSKRSGRRATPRRRRRASNR
jgi:uncharacterized membrane protein YqiK